MNIFFVVALSRSILSGACHLLWDESLNHGEKENFDDSMIVQPTHETVRRRDFFKEALEMEKHEELGNVVNGQHDT